MSRLGIYGDSLFKIIVRHKVKRNVVVRCIASSCRRHLAPSKFSRIQTAGVDVSRLKYNGIVMSLRHFSDLPSHSRVLLPALSPTMEMGTIVSWAKKEGDKLNEGDLLAEIETDKATMGFETPEEGYLAKILVPAGTRDVPIGKLVCIIVENEKDIVAFKDFKDDGAAAAAGAPKPAASAPSPAAPAAAQPRPASPSRSEPLTEKGRVYASPMAKRLAEKKNIRLEGLGKGSGLYGSLTSEDVERMGSGAQTSVPSQPGAKFTDIPLTTMRSVIAKRLLQSKTTIPHFYLTLDICVDQMLAARASINDNLKKAKSQDKVSVNDIILKATAMACRKVPEANSAWMDTHIRQYNTVDVSVAVSTDKGLLTPIVFNADTRGLLDISRTVKILAKKAREGKLQPQEFQGGTISISNLGMYGITHFSAIINPPQSCILAIGGTQERLALVKDKVVKTNYMCVTLSCDHRVVDGAVGAMWLAEFKKMIESPINMIL